MRHPVAPDAPDDGEKRPILRQPLAQRDAAIAAVAWDSSLYALGAPGIVFRVGNVLKGVGM